MAMPDETPSLNRRFGISRESVYASVERITPDVARRYLAANKANRSLNPRTVKKLAAAMMRSEWVLNGESIKFDENGNLIDGQHRLAAIIEADKAIDILVFRGASPEAQDTVDLGSRRSLAAALKIRQIPNHTAIAAAIAWLHRLQSVGDGRASYSSLFGAESYPTVPQGLRLLEKNPAIKDSTPSAQRVYAETRFPKGLGIALHYTFATIDRDDAEVFFDYWASGAGLDEEHPIYALRRAIHIYNERPRKPSQSYYAAVAIKAWNKFKEGSPVKALNWSPGGAKQEKFPPIRDY